MAKVLGMPIPYPNETSASVLMRAAYLNGWGHVRSFLSAMVGKHIPKVRDRDQLNAILILISLQTCKNFSDHTDRSLLNDLVAANFDEALQRKIPCRALREEGSAVCPECLVEANYLRRSWSLRFVLNCSHHSCRLITRCPRCQENFNWDRPAPDVCQCDYDLKLSTIVKVDCSAQKALIEFFYSNNPEIVDSSFEILIAVSEVFDLLDADGEYSYAVDLLNRGSNFLSNLRDLVISGMHKLHPRIALLPFLKRDKFLKDIALEILKDIEDGNSVIPLKPMHQQGGALTIRDAKYALGLRENAQIKNLFEKGLLKFADRFQVFVTMQSVDNLLRRLTWSVPRSRGGIADRNLVSASNPSIIMKFRNPNFYQAHSLIFGIAKTYSYNWSAPMRSTHDTPAAFGVRDAGVFLGLSPSVVYRLMHWGYLKYSIKLKNLQLFSQIELVELARFDHEVVVFNVLVRSLRSDRKKLRDYLSQAGVLPIRPNLADQFNRNLFPRRQVEELIARGEYPRRQRR